MWTWSACAECEEDSGLTITQTENIKKQTQKKKRRENKKKMRNNIECNANISEKAEIC